MRLCFCMLYACVRLTRALPFDQYRIKVGHTSQLSVVTGFANEINYFNHMFAWCCCLLENLHLRRRCAAPGSFSPDNGQTTRGEKSECVKFRANCVITIGLGVILFVRNHHRTFCFRDDLKDISARFEIKIT